MYGNVSKKDNMQEVFVAKARDREKRGKYYRQDWNVTNFPL